MAQRTANEKPAPVETVTDDWPKYMPILEGELELLEQHMLDILIALTEHD